MKFKFLYSLVIVFGVCSCTEEIENEYGLNGTYVRFSQHEFGKEYDTIMIKAQDASNKIQVYDVIRKWKYERVLDGEQLQPEYKQSASTIRYKEQEFREEETGLLYRWNPKTNQLFIGSTSYERL